MKGKRKVVLLLIGFFVLFYGCWVVMYSIYQENMPVVSVRDAVTTKLEFDDVVVCYFHRVQQNLDYESFFSGKVEEVYAKSFSDIGMGAPVARFATDGLQPQLEALRTAAQNSTDPEEKKTLEDQVRLLGQVIETGGLLPAQQAWLDATVHLAPGDEVKAGDVLYSGTAATKKAYLSWSMSMNDSLYFERGNPVEQLQLPVVEEYRGGSRTINRKFDFTITRKVYNPETDRYIYQIDLPEDVNFSIVDGSVVLMRIKGEGKNAHGGVVPLSAVSFDEMNVTMYLLRDRDRVWGKEYYVEEYKTVAEEMAGNLVALASFPSGSQVVYITDKPLKNGVAVRVQR